MYGLGDIGARREAMGMTQGQLAVASGCSQQQISRYETGKARPRATVAARLERALSGLASGSKCPDQCSARGTTAPRGRPESAAPELRAARLALRAQSSEFARQAANLRASVAALRAKVVAFAEVACGRGANADQEDAA